MDGQVLVLLLINKYSKGRAKMKPVKKDKSGYKEKCCRKCRYWDEDSVECKRRSPTIPAITEPSGVDSFTGY